MGAPKALLVLATLREHYTVVLAHQIEREVRRAIATRIANAPEVERATLEGTLLGSFDGWLGRVNLERWPAPAQDEVYKHLSNIMPVLRHLNDLEAVVTAMQARPDWVISTNTDHWGPDLADRTGLRVGTPMAFLQHISSQQNTVPTVQVASATEGYFKALEAYLDQQHTLFPPFGEIAMRMINREGRSYVILTVIELHKDGTFKVRLTQTLLLPPRYDGFQIYLPELGDHEVGSMVISRAPLVRTAPFVPFPVQAPALRTALHAALDAALATPVRYDRSLVFLNTTAAGYAHALDTFIDPPELPGVPKEVAFQNAVKRVVNRKIDTSVVSLIT